MERTAGVESVLIKSLFSNRNIHLNFSGEVVILVGENGLGKTTILSILNEIFEGTPENIVDFPLTAIEVKLLHFDKPLIFTKESMKEFIEMRNHLLEDFEEEGLNRLIECFSETDAALSQDAATIEETLRNILNNNPSIENALMAVNVSPVKLIGKWIFDFPSVFIFKNEIKRLRYNVVFLPTYRRIEADINKAIANTSPLYIRTGKRGSDDIRIPSSVIRNHFFSKESPIKFGMKDISDHIDRLLNDIATESIKGYGEVSGKMIARLLDPKPDSLNIEKINPEQVKIILERLGSNIPEEERQRLEEAIETGNINENENLAYYLVALSDVYRRTEEYDIELKSFKDEANKFLYDKEFRYDENHIKLGLYFNRGENKNQPISIEKLSSGEKQLIAILAMAYLSYKRNLVFIIDEPELSLSLIWQKKLLPSLREAPNTNLIIAATHSPFIFDNDLKAYTIGSAEYATPINN
ncbi:MAG: ATP-binding protein [Muribaculaceae bacterium]|nr:ATP-binding protein [Muribaculaceae bacterium]